MALPTVSAVATTGNEGDGYVDVVFHLSAAAAAPVSISYATANGSAGGENYGSDFAFTGTRTLTFAAGETTKVVRLALLNDSVAEPNETFYLNLFSAVGAVVEAERIRALAATAVFVAQLFNIVFARLSAFVHEQGAERRLQGSLRYRCLQGSLHADLVPPVAAIERSEQADRSDDHHARQQRRKQYFQQREAAGGRRGFGQAGGH